MRFDLTPLIKSEGMSKEINYSLDLSEFELVNYRPFKEPILVLGSIFNIGGALVIKATAKTMFNGLCDRCQKEFSLPIFLEFESNIALKETENVRDDTIIASDGMLQIDDIVRENLILSIPSKLLCKDDCKGLCFICGIDLNVQSCKCNKNEFDPRLSVLKNLL